MEPPNSELRYSHGVDSRALKQDASDKSVSMLESGAGVDLDEPSKLVNSLSE